MEPWLSCGNQSVGFVLILLVICPNPDTGQAITSDHSANEDRRSGARRNSRWLGGKGFTARGEGGDALGGTTMTRTAYLL